MRPTIGATGLSGVLILLFSSCSGSGPDSLIGEYALESGGRAEVKISKSGDHLVVTVREGDSWARPAALVVCKEQDYTELFGSSWRQIEPMGLRAIDSPFGIFRVKKGATVNGHTFKTGYFLFFLSVGDIYKL